VAIGVSNCGVEGFNFVEEHQHVGDVCRYRDCRVSHQYYLVVAVDPGKCKGRLGDFHCILDEPVESVEDIISPFLQFGGWKSSVSRDNEFSLDARQRFRNDCRQCRFLLFVCNSGKRFLIVFSCCSNMRSPGEIIGGWFMWAWGGWYACALSRGSAEDLPLSGLMPVVLLGAGVAFCCWHVWWSSVVMEATCFSSSQIQFVLVACKESMAFSMHSTCRESCMIS
jgi:hypothetical protein